MKRISSVYEIIDLFDGFLFDAYGVLVNEQGVLPGAIDLLEKLKKLQKPYWMLSNGSSKTVENTAKKYVDMGLGFEENQVITSGGLLASCLPKVSENGEKVAVLGTPGSFQLVRDAGRVPVDPLKDNDYRILVIANQTEFPFVESVDEVLSKASLELDSGRDFKIILTNPDLFYPRSIDSFGITAGSISLILEESLKLRYGTLPDELFWKLGKPFSPMYDMAKARAGSSNLCMVGDQIYTDIKGAKDADLSSLLMCTGLTGREMLDNIPSHLQPDFYLDSFEGDLR